jgi:hypothetical protein
LGAGALLCVPPEALFIWKIEDLKAILANPNEKNLLESSAILRMLLLDEHPLIHQANRNVGVRIAFMVVNLESSPTACEKGLFISQRATGSPQI